MKWILAFALLLVPAYSAAQLPDAPSTIKPPSQRDVNSSNGNSLEPLTWKQTLNWKFATVHGVFLGAMLFDQQETLKGEAMGCFLEGDDPKPYYATRTDLMKKNMTWFSVFTVADMLLRKAGLPVGWAAGGAVGTVLHLQGGIKAYNMINRCR
jgi:hypothetical protein